MKCTTSIIIALLSLVISIISLVFQFRYKPLGEGIENYSFSEPLEAYKSILSMDINKDFLARIQLNAAMIDRKTKERLETINISKTREYEGKTILFIEYKEAGLPKHDIIGMEKDAASGFWNEVFISEYGMESTSPTIAAEIKMWKSSIN